MPTQNIPKGSSLISGQASTAVTSGNSHVSGYGRGSSPGTTFPTNSSISNQLNRAFYSTPGGGGIQFPQMQRGTALNTRQTYRSQATQRLGQINTNATPKPSLGPRTINEAARLNRGLNNSPSVRGTSVGTSSAGRAINSFGGARGNVASSAGTAITGSVKTNAAIQSWNAARAASSATPSLPKGSIPAAGGAAATALGAGNVAAPGALGLSGVSSVPLAITAGLGLAALGLGLLVGNSIYEGIGRPFGPSLMDYIRPQSNKSESTVQPNPIGSIATSEIIKDNQGNPIDLDPSGRYNFYARSGISAGRINPATGQYEVYRTAEQAMARAGWGFYQITGRLGYVREDQPNLQPGYYGERHYLTQNGKQILRRLAGNYVPRYLGGYTNSFQKADMTYEIRDFQRVDTPDNDYQPIFQNQAKPRTFPFSETQPTATTTTTSPAQLKTPQTSQTPFVPYAPEPAPLPLGTPTKPDGTPDIAENPVLPEVQPASPSTAPRRSRTPGNTPNLTPGQQPRTVPTPQEEPELEPLPAETIEENTLLKELRERQEVLENQVPNLLIPALAARKGTNPLPEEQPANPQNLPQTGKNKNCGCNGAINAHTDQVGQQLSDKLDKINPFKAEDLANLGLLATILDAVNAVKGAVGVDAFPITAPSTLNAKSRGTTTLNNLTDMHEWNARNLDSVVGQWPNSMGMEDGSDVEFDGVADQLNELMGINMAIALAVGINQQQGTKALVELQGIKQETHLAHKHAQANSEFLGFRMNQKKVNAPSSITTGANDITSFLNPGTNNLISVENSDDEDLQGKLNTLCEAAAIIIARYKRTVDPNDPAKDIRERIEQAKRIRDDKLTVGGKQAIDDFAEFVQQVEEGFGRADSYGRDNTQNPRIVDLSED